MIEKKSYNITLKEIKEAMESLKNKKISGLDGITNEILKCGGPNVQKEIATLLRENYEHRNNIARKYYNK
jgi:hypothetical protein